MPQLSINDLKYLVKIGVNIENHTYSHGEFYDAKSFLSNVIEAQDWIFSKLGVRPSSLAFPRGDEVKLGEQEWSVLNQHGINNVFGTKRYTNVKELVVGRHHIMPHWPEKTLEYFFGN